MTQKRSLIWTRRCTVAASASVSNSKVSAISVRPTGASRSTPSVPRASQWPSATTLPPRSFTPIAVATDLVVPELQKRGRYKRDYAPGTLREKFYRAGARLPDTHPGARHRNLAGLGEALSAAE